MQAKMEFCKGVCVQLQHNACAKEENGIFTSSGFSAYDGDPSVSGSVVFCTGLFRCMCMHGVIQREVHGIFVLSVRHLLFQYQLLLYAGGRCGMEEQSSCLDWEFSLGPPPERSRWISD